MKSICCQALPLLRSVYKVVQQERDGGTKKKGKAAEVVIQVALPCSKKWRSNAEHLAAVLQKQGVIARVCESEKADKRFAVLVDSECYYEKVGGGSQRHFLHDEPQLVPSD